MPATPSARASGSKRHRTAAIWSILLAAAFSNAAHAQLAGSITISNLPQYASGPSAMDAAGNVYIGTGGLYTWPVTAGAAQTQPGCTGTIGQTTTAKIGIGPPPGSGPQPCTDAYLTKVNANGVTVYATFLGGPFLDTATAVTVDSSGNLYAAGLTGGSFPTTANAAIASSTTSTTFAAKLNKTGSAFLYVTYLPAALAKISSIAVDSQGNAYVFGTTTTNHAMVVALSADGSAFLYTTTFAGSQQESGEALVIDPSGDAVVTGLTDSPDFPVTAGVVQPHYGGNYDQFVAKLSPAGNIVFSTYLGGSGAESYALLQTDAAGNIYVTGTTKSSDFPTTSGAYQSSPSIPIWSNSSPGGFLVSLSPNGTMLLYSTYILSPDQIGGPYSMAVNTAGDVYLLNAGLAGSPVTPSAPQPCYDGGNDAVLIHFGAGGRLEDSTFIGDPHVSLPSNNYLPVDGSIMLLSTTGGTSGVPAFEKVRLGEPGWTAPACITPTALNGATLYSQGQVVAPGEVVSLVGNGIGPATGIAYQPGSSGQAPRLLGGVQVFFDGIAAPIIYAQSNQVNLVVPVEMSGQSSATVTLQYQNTILGPFTQHFSAFDPGIFRWNPGVSSQAAAINQNGTINGPANPAPAGSIVSLWGTGFGPLASPCSDGNLNVDAAVYLATGYSVLLNSGSVSYAGGAPLLLCGAMQMNVQIPANAPSGNFPIFPESEYQVGNSLTATTASIGATIVVK